MAEQAGNSDLILENREKLTVTGVRRVLQCNAESAAIETARGVLRWYMPGSAFLCAFGAERLLRPALQALEQGLFWLAAGPLRLARRAWQPLEAARKNRVEQARARRAQKRSAKKPKKNLPSTRRLLYNSNVSK